MNLSRRPNVDMSLGVQHIYNSIMSKFPYLSERDAEILTNAVLDEIASRITAGEDLAFIRRNTDGTVDLTVLALEIVDGME